MTEKIQNGIPIPPRSGGGGVGRGYASRIAQTLRQCLIGSSFFESAPELKDREKVRNAVWALVRTRPEFMGWGVVTRKVRENDVIGIRVWRTK